MATAFPSPDSSKSPLEEFLDREMQELTDVSKETKTYLGEQLESELDKSENEKKETDGEKSCKVMSETGSEKSYTVMSDTDSDKSYAYLKRSVLSKALIRRNSKDEPWPPQDSGPMPEALTGIDWKLPFEKTHRFMNKLLERRTPGEKLKPMFEKFLESERMKKTEETLTDFAKKVRHFVRVITGDKVFKKWNSMEEEEKRRPSIEKANEDDTDIESMFDED